MIAINMLILFPPSTANFSPPTPKNIITEDANTPSNVPIISESGIPLNTEQ